MTRPLPKWLAGRHALIAGRGAAVQALAARFTELGATVSWADPGLLDGAAIEALLRKAVPPPTILVHAGTPILGASAETVDLAVWRATLSADIDGRFLFATEFARRLFGVAKPGAILFLMPDASPEAGRAASLTSHGAVDSLIKTLAVEWGRDGLRINGIASRVVERFAAATPAQQAALGNLAAYLCSDYAA